MSTSLPSLSPADADTLLTSLMAGATQGIGFLDPDLRVIDMNPLLAQLGGVDRDRSLGRAFRELFPHHADLLEPVLRRVLATGEAVHQLQVTGDQSAGHGGRVPWQVNCYPLRSPSAVVLGVGLQVEEIADSRIEELLLTNEIAERSRVERLLEEKLRDTEAVRQRLEAECLSLESAVRKLTGQETIVGESPALTTVLSQALRVARTDTTVLIQGETGTGKELLAQFIHQNSSRSRHPQVKINCAAIPVTLLEGELFGWEKGAYTHAVSSQAGLFETADGSTLVLDEIGELPLDAQVKLLRVLQDGQFYRLGGNRARKTDVRIIAATNRDLANEVRRGRFREDLFYRLNVFPLTVPPLRERAEDIPALVRFFIAELGTQLNSRISSITSQDMDALVRYPWPGNIRELRNVIENALILSRGDTLAIRLPQFSSAPDRAVTLQELEYRHIMAVLHSTNWTVHGPNGAARILGLHPSTLFSRMKKLGIPRRSHKPTP